MGDRALGRIALVGPSLRSWTLLFCPYLDPSGPLSFFWRFPVLPLLLLLAWPCLIVRGRTCSQPSSRVLAPPSRVSRHEQLRQLAAQLASSASLEYVVTHGIQSLLNSLPGLVAPMVANERALPVSVSRPRSRSRSRGSILLSESGSPTGLVVKSCPAAAPERSYTPRCRSATPALAPGSQEPSSAASSARASSLPVARGASAGSTRRDTSTRARYCSCAPCICGEPSACPNQWAEIASEGGVLLYNLIEVWMCATLLLHSTRSLPRDSCSY